MIYSRPSVQVSIGQHILNCNSCTAVCNCSVPVAVSGASVVRSSVVQIVSTMVNMSGPGDIHEHTLLIIIGDHGQTMSGDHGGGSDEEVDSAIIAVNLAAAWKRHGEDEESDSHMQQSVLENTAVIDQLDFAASISALLGLPQPFESVGEFIRAIKLSVLLNCNHVRERLLTLACNWLLSDKLYSKWSAVRLMLWNEIIQGAQ